MEIQNTGIKLGKKVPRVVNRPWEMPNFKEQRTGHWDKRTLHLLLLPKNAAVGKHVLLL